MDCDYPEIIHVSHAHCGLSERGLVEPELALASLKKSLKLLEAAACSHVAIPCNSLHPLLPALQDETPMQLLDMVHSCCLAVQEATMRLPGCVVVLGSDSTKKSDIFIEPLRKLGVNCVSADKQVQILTDTHILQAMKEGSTPALRQRLQRLIEHAAKIATRSMRTELAASTNISGSSILAARPFQVTVVLGCTELSLLSTENPRTWPCPVPVGSLNVDIQVVDSMSSLVNTTVAAYHQYKSVSNAAGTAQPSNTHKSPVKEIY